MLYNTDNDYIIKSYVEPFCVLPRRCIKYIRWLILLVWKSTKPRLGGFQLIELIYNETIVTIKLRARALVRIEMFTKFKQ